jgi:hypothetical protein
MHGWRPVTTSIFAQMVSSEANLEQLRDYYFNIFCHSQMSALSDKFVAKFENIDFDRFIDWMVDNFSQLVVPVFVDCSITAIVQWLSTNHLDDLPES